MATIATVAPQDLRVVVVALASELASIMISKNRQPILIRLKNGGTLKAYPVPTDDHSGQEWFVALDGSVFYNTRVSRQQHPLGCYRYHPNQTANGRLRAVLAQALTRLANTTHKPR